MSFPGALLTAGSAICQQLGDAVGRSWRQFAAGGSRESPFSFPMNISALVYRYRL